MIRCMHSCGQIVFLSATPTASAMQIVFHDAADLPLTHCPACAEALTCQSVRVALPTETPNTRPTPPVVVLHLVADHLPALDAADLHDLRRDLLLAVRVVRAEQRRRTAERSR